MTREQTQPQYVYWRNGTPEAAHLSDSLTNEWDGRIKLVDTPDQFLQAVDHPRLQLIVLHDVAMTGEILQKVQSNCPDAVLVVVSDDESKLPKSVRDQAHHVLNSRQLDQVLPLIRRSLRDSTRLWALKDSENSANQRAEMLDVVEEAVVVQRRDGTVSTWNKAATRIFGWTEQEAIGRKHSDLLKIVNDVCEPEIKVALRTDRTWSGEIHYRGKENRTAIVQSRRSWLRNDAANGLIEICTDVTDWRLELSKANLISQIQEVFRSSSSLKESVEQCALMAVPLLADACAIDMMDEDDVIRRVAFTGKHPDLVELIPALKEDYPIFPSNRRTVADALRSPQPQIIAPIEDLAVFLGVSNEAHKKQLQKISAAAAMTAVIPAIGKSMGVVTFIFTDPSRKWLAGDRQRLAQLTSTIGAFIEHSELDRRLKKAHTKSDAGLHYKDAFLGAVSHELRTPLQAMFGWTQLMRDKKLTQPETERALDAFELSLNMLTKIVNDLLDLSRINSGKLELSARPIALQPLIEQTLEAFEVSAGMKQIEIKLLAPEDQPIWIMADTAWLQRAFWNILSNSVKFTPLGGTVTISLSCNAAFAEVTIADTGIGIEPQFLPHIFEHFSQEETSTTRSHYGLGIGLAISRHVVEAHGGRIDAESAGKNEGATFTVKIPRCAAAESARESETPTPAESSQADVSLAGVRVLVVEDEADTRSLLAFVLAQAGATVVEAASAREGLAAFNKASFDILISDIGMPQEDGVSLIRKIRALPPERGGRVPALALTAYASKEDRMQTLRAGYHLHLPKPVDISELLLVVMALVNNPHK